ncbi:unnamed protein product [Jaminaea pallidilutea]
MGKKDKLSSNPADAARKAARQRELRKNKASREQAKEFALVKKDTRSLEEDLRRLHRSQGDSGEISRLQTEIAKAKEAKDKYLQQHPEHRKFIYPHEKSAEENAAATAGQDDGRGLFRPDGRPRHPERSVYYDPVFNPWGNPPPGMPYAEKPPHLWPSSSSAAHGQSQALGVGDGQDLQQDSDDDDDDIVMPSGPPPAVSNLAQAAGQESSDDDDDDDDIVMPSGPPPGQPPNIQANSSNMQGTAAMRPMPPPPPPGGYAGPPPGFPMAPPPPVGWQQPPRPPPGFSGHGGSAHPFSYPGGGYARPPPAFAPQPRPPFQGQHAPVHPHSRPPPNAPKGPAARDASQRRPPAKSENAGSSSTIEAKPQLTKPDGSSAKDKTSATISSAPVMRDLKKEATTFVPDTIRRQKAKAQRKAQIAGLGKRGIRANPVVEDEETIEPATGPEYEVEDDTNPLANNQEEPAPEPYTDFDEDERIDPASLAYSGSATRPPSSLAEAPQRAVASAKSASPPAGPATSAHKPTGGLLSYYSDSEDEDSDGADAGDLGAEDRASVTAPAVPASKASSHSPLPPPPSTSSSSSKGTGRVNLVEALSSVPLRNQQQPGQHGQQQQQGATSTKEEYRRYLDSIGDLLAEDGEGGHDN